MGRSCRARCHLRLSVSDARLREALHVCRDAVVAPSVGQVMTMARKELISIAESLVAAILKDEIAWIETHEIACTIQFTEDEHVYLLGFEQQAQALLFQRRWGGEFDLSQGSSAVH